jgi:DNA topoisomerase-1
MSKTVVVVESPAKISKLKTILGNNYEIVASVGHIMDLPEKKLSVDINDNFKPTYEPYPDKKKVIDNIKRAATNCKEVLIATDGDREGEMIGWCVAQILKIKEPKRIIFHSITKTAVANAVKNPKKMDYAMIDAQKTRRILDRIVGYELSPILWRCVRANLSGGRVQSVVVRILIDRENEINEFLKKDDVTFYKITGEFLNPTSKQNLKAVLFDCNATLQTNSDSDEEIIKTKSNNPKINKAKKNKKNTDSTDATDIDESEHMDSADSTKGQIAKIKNTTIVRNLMKNLSVSKFIVKDVSEREGTRQPSAPFSTSTLQQEAGRKFGFSVKRTMSVAQTLYENGLITYMRTDSTTIDPEPMAELKKYIIDTYGNEFWRGKQYETKATNIQDGHEAIRPCDVEVVDAEEQGKIGADEIKLYKLIWKRTVASQMVPAKIRMVDIIISADKIEKDNYYFKTVFESVTFLGFLIVYNIKNVENDPDDKSDNLDDLDIIQDKNIPKIGQILDPQQICSVQEYTKPKTRYNEISLVQKLDPKNLNIGRPATYASIITKIQEKGYVKKGNIDGVEKDCLTMNLVWNNKKPTITEKAKKIIIGKETNKLIPTEIGTKVTQFLVEHFPEVMDYKFTANMENKLDDVAKGNAVWHEVLSEFYEKFHPLVEKLMTSESAIIKTSPNAKILGMHPTKQKEIVVTVARGVPVLRISLTKTKAIYRDIPETISKDEITLEQAIDLFDNQIGYPFVVGLYKDSEVLLHKGKENYYLEHLKKTYTIKPENIPENGVDKISLDETIKIIDEKAKFIIKEFVNNKKLIIIKTGDYGPFIRVEDTVKKTHKNVKIPKDIDATKLTEELTLELVNAKYVKKQPVKKATPVKDPKKTLIKKFINTPTGSEEVPIEKEKEKPKVIKPIKKAIKMKDVKEIKVIKINKSKKVKAP